MGVKITVLDELGDPDAEPGSKPWAIYFVNQTRLVRNQLNTSVVRLQNLMTKLEKHRAWEAFGLASLSMLAAKKIGLEPEQIEAVISAPKDKKIGDVIPAITDHGRSHEAKDPKTGRFTRDSKNENGISGREVTGGNNTPYRLAKLKRDHPEIIERIQAGEFKNVREAERALGLKVPAKLTKVEKLVRAYKRLTDAEKIQFLAAVQ